MGGRSLSKRTFTAEDHRLADEVGRRWRRIPKAERKRQLIGDIINQVLNENGYVDLTERRERYRAMCVILGSRGGSVKRQPAKKAPVPATAVAVGSQPPQFLRAAPRRNPSPFWPSITPEMGEEDRHRAEERRRSLCVEMALLARQRRDGLARASD